MKIIKVLCSNAVMVVAGEKELILVGRGIGFGRKKGEWVNHEGVEKVFQKQE
ncbi:CAT RNA binding domain-containing protein [Enterococcus canis]|nr:CAT RNA binding domain-containing protein [Enterococcus canis]